MWTPATRCCLHRRQRRRNDFQRPRAGGGVAQCSIPARCKSSRRTNILWRTANNQPARRHHVAVAMALAFPIPPSHHFSRFGHSSTRTHSAAPAMISATSLSADGQDAAGSAVIAAWSSLSPTWACARDLREVQTAVVDELAKTAARFGAFCALSFGADSCTASNQHVSR